MSTGDSTPPAAPALSEAVIWHEVECGGYGADLSLWRELASERPGPLLELGAGAGRVALDLGRRGHRVTALEGDPDLAAALRDRAAAESLSIDVEDADARSLAPDRRFALVLAPMQFIQLFGPDDRRWLLERIAAALTPSGLAALATVESGALRAAPGPSPTPDMREVDGWVYSSRPLWVDLAPDGLTVRRLRQRVSPAGKVSESVHEQWLARLDAAAIEAEAVAAGLRPAGRRPIANQPGEADSTAILLAAGARR